MSASSSAHSDQEAISRSIEHLVRLVDDLEGRLTRSSDAGVKLANAVRDYMDYMANPKISALEANLTLLKANELYLSLHAGNFH